MNIDNTTKAIVIYKSIKITCWTPYSVICQIYLIKNTEEKIVLLLLLLAAIYRTVTMCQALCFMYVTNPSGTLIVQELIYPFYRYQGSDNLNNLPRK